MPARAAANEMDWPWLPRVAETTPAQLRAAGNAGGEILNWLVMLGTIDARPASFIEAQLDEGHAFAAWGAR